MTDKNDLGRSQSVPENDLRAIDTQSPSMPTSSTQLGPP